MAGEVAERATKNGKKGLRRPKRRLSIRIDMTPMVDIAFLLLIFYMVTTVFSMPQAMEINLPPEEEDPQRIEIKESNLLTIRVDEESRFWWNMKRVGVDNLPQLLPTHPNTPDTVAYRFYPDTLRGLLMARNLENPKLSTLIKIHREGTYADMVNILDEIDFLERSWNQHTADEQGVKVEDLKEKFSYRYAIDDWQERDSKVLLSAVAEAQAKGEL